MVYSLNDLKNSELTETRHYLVVGNPVGHSLSPLMHQTALDYYRLDAVYAALELQPNEIAGFAAWCNLDSFLGCNITLPYKELLLSLVDTVQDSAMEIGAINTIVKNENTLAGYNTDIYGFLAPLIDLQNVIEGGRAIVFGTGGASKAIKAALRQLGVMEIIFVSRNPSVKAITDDSLHIQMADYSQWQWYAEDAELFVNATPVGMYPNTEDLFINEDDAQLFANKICYDLIYNPIMTTFLKLADRAGAVVINGLEMFIQQGNRSFELWTNKSFPVKEIEKKLLEKLGHL